MHGAFAFDPDLPGQLPLGDTTQHDRDDPTPHPRTKLHLWAATFERAAWHLGELSYLNSRVIETLRARVSPTGDDCSQRSTRYEICSGVAPGASRMTL